MPHRSSVPMSWRLSKYRYGLVGTRCKNEKCMALHFPPRSVCRNCGSLGLEEFKFSGKGVVVSYTIIHTAPEGFENMVPYAVGLIKLEEGPVVSGHIVGGLGKIAIGKPVSAVFRKLYEDGKAGIINYGFKFELDE